MAGTFISLPSATNAYWDSAVLTVGDLPAAGNTTGETRLVLADMSLRSWDGSAWVVTAPGPGSNVTGPGSSTDDALVRWNGTGGTVVQNSTATLSDAGALSVASVSASGQIAGATAVIGTINGPLRGTTGNVGTGPTALGSEVSGTLPIANGGTNSAAALTGSKLLRSSATALVESTVTDDGAGNLAAVTSLVAGGGALTAGAALEVNSTTKTFLLPRMTAAQRDALAAAPNGSLIYNTDSNKVQARENGAWLDITGWGS